MSPARPGQSITDHERIVVAAYLKADNADAAGAECDPPIKAHTVREHYRRVQDKTGLSRAELTILLCSPVPPEIPRRLPRRRPGVPETLVLWP